MDDIVADVDIVCANYNNAQFLREFFDSIVASTVRPRAVIFVDDGSVDDSVAIANEYLTVIDGLRVIELGQNEGFGNALNVGVQASNAKYIMRADPDDIVHEERIEKQVRLLESGKFDVVGSNALIFHSGTRKALGRTNFPFSHDDIGRRFEDGEHGVLHATVMMKAELLKNNLYKQENVPAEDYDVFARIYQSGARFANVPDCFIFYRVHPNSASNILPFSTILKTYALRDSLFKKRTRYIKIVLYYIHHKCYRKYLFATKVPSRLFFGSISIMFYPSKLVRRVRSKAYQHRMARRQWR
ncbi:MAG TPA: glycosyltransferase [Gammaproteobacteria bacterium]|nr:glycosyltransferase [Gammaproteobacteria bacterium]